MEGKELIRKKRTQRDYTLPFKLAVVSAVEKGEMSYKQAQERYGIQGKSTVLEWLRKHGTQNWKISMKNLKKCPKSKETPCQKIKRLEKELTDSKQLCLLYDEMLNIINREHGIDLRKKLLSKQLDTYNSIKK